MRTIIIGLDAFDPAYFEQLHSKGKIPNLSKLVKAGGYSRLRVTNPPQSEVSWTSIATGVNPGGHGIFDFVHRNPASYGLQVSLLPTQRNILGLQFVPPHNTRTLFDEAVSDGYPATSLWWPATFPARLESPVRTIPGLGTPDILGRLGVGCYFSTELLPEDSERKTPNILLTQKGRGRYTGKFEVPGLKDFANTRISILEFDLQLDESRSARLFIGKQTIDLKFGQWGPIFELPFKIGFGISIKAVSRAILSGSASAPGLYFLPLQPHPLSAPWPYATPKGFVKEAWNSQGPFLTLGWPQDTTALEEGYINDEQFLTLCNLIDEERERVLMHQMNSFDEGVLACIFDSLDRIQHMFWKSRRDILETWYTKLDTLVGRIQKKMAVMPGTEKVHLLIASDHGFGEYNYKVHLNRWLVNHNYLAPQQQGQSGNLTVTDWTKTQAYALGLNSLYLNLDGREGQGIISASKKSELVQSLRDELLQWKGPDGRQVIHNVLTQAEAFQGTLAEYGPDLLVGYHPPYRGSAETGMGQWKGEEIETNHDHWGADHCFDAAAVPGVLFSNQGLANLSNPSYADIPSLAIGKALRSSNSAPPPTFSDEDQEQVEKRLKDLGYL
jgi:predicted AlkP superfamily phosphohydrolase/phosphomutase